MLREREHFRTDLQMCLVRGTKIYLKLKRTLLESEADSTPTYQEIRSLADRQDTCSLHKPEDDAIPFRRRAAYKEDVASTQFLFYFFAQPADLNMPTLERYRACFLRQQWPKRKIPIHANK